MTQDTLRVAVVGAGMMGANHIERIRYRTRGATVVAIVEPDLERARAAKVHAPKAEIFSDIDQALAWGQIDAVLIATPGQFHESVLMPSMAAGLQIFCEKPITFDTESALRVIAAEMLLEKPVIQVGFMRRFDPEYRELKALIESRENGALLALHCAHRNPRVDSFEDHRMITDSVIHEIDVIPWLAGEQIVSIEVRKPRRNTLAPLGFHDPQMVFIETESGIFADVEINVSVQFGYQVHTDAVLESAVAKIGRTGGMQVYRDGAVSVKEHQDFRTRFAAAYDTEIQEWIDNASRKIVVGPNAWDGYMANVVSSAGVESQSSGKRVEVKLEKRPAFYN